METFSTVRERNNLGSICNKLLANEVKFHFIYPLLLLLKTFIIHSFNALLKLFRLLLF